MFPHNGCGLETGAIKFFINLYGLKIIYISLLNMQPLYNYKSSMEIKKYTDELTHSP